MIRLSPTVLSKSWRRAWSLLAAATIIPGGWTTQTIVPLTAHAAYEATIQQLWDQLTPVFDDIAATAPQRDAAGTTDTSSVEQLRAAGFTRLRVPRQYGGHGLSLPQAYEFFVALAAADSNFAQALRAHW